MLALGDLLASEGAGDGAQTHFAPRAKRVIYLFMHGGPSHVDLFDPKPEPTKYAGQTLPESFGEVMTRRKVANDPLLGPIKPFRPGGKSGLPVSDFLPEMRKMADDLCVIRSCHGDSVNHPQSVYQMNTGSILIAGVRGGYAHGATDAIGLRAAENKVHVNDLHATILYLLGMDHERLTFFHGGRDERLTDVAGKVVQEVLA